MTKVAVYGSLRKGDYNHPMIEGQEFLGSVDVDGFNLYSLGWYPCIYPAKDGLFL